MDLKDKQALNPIELEIGKTYYLDDEFIIFGEFVKICKKTDTVYFKSENNNKYCVNSRGLIPFSSFNNKGTNYFYFKKL